MTVALPLLTWVSPAFPIGAFAYSGGLEAAVARGIVCDEATLREWLDASLRGGTIRMDALAVALAVRADDTALAELDELMIALAGSPTREGELRALGAAFAEATVAWRDTDLPAAYPVALGALAGKHRMDAPEVAALFAHAAALNAVQPAQRLLPLGQRAAMRVVAALEPALTALRGDAETVTVDDLSSATPIADICALAHPTIEPRLFRS